jgi:hypothetical protein
MKRFVAGIVIGSALAISTSVFADSIEQYILTKVNYPLVVKGKEYANADLPVLNYQGNTYVPLKAIGDVLGTKVNWNDQLKRVEIGNNEVSNQGTSVSNENNATSISPLTGYTLVVKIKGDIYLLRDVKSSQHLYRDNKENYYQIPDVTSLESLIGVANNDYVINDTTTSFAKGIVDVKDNNYIKMEEKHVGIDDELVRESTFYNADKSKSYEFSTQSNAVRGFMKIDGMYYISYKDVFNALGINYKIEVDDKQKLVIFSFE